MFILHGTWQPAQWNFAINKVPAVFRSAKPDCGWITLREIPKDLFLIFADRENNSRKPVLLKVKFTAPVSTCISSAGMATKWTASFSSSENNQSKCMIIQSAVEYRGWWHSDDSALRSALTLSSRSLSNHRPFHFTNRVITICVTFRQFFIEETYFITYRIFHTCKSNLLALEMFYLEDTWNSLLNLFIDFRISLHSS